MKTENRNRELAQEIRELFDSYVDAVRALDIERIAAHYAPDVVAYDAVFQLEFAGREAYVAHWKACLEHCQSMIFEPRPPAIIGSGDLACAHYLVRCGGAGPDGKVHSGWMRATFVAHKRDGRWLIVHEHYSMPFDPLTDKILGSLEPQAAQPADAA